MRWRSSGRSCVWAFRDSRLEAKAASSSTGVPLGSGLSRSQLLALTSLGPIAELGVAQVGTASETIPVLELLESSGDPASFSTSDRRRG